MSSDNNTNARPKIALLGEFSAGKSTLVNALLDRASSPVRVTATHVPPIWYSHGDQPPLRISLDGEEEVVHGDDLTEIPMEDTRCVRVFLEAPILERCDLMDMPGSSDPNMTPDIWDALLPTADAVIWCTPATQAWRQSEAAIWEDVPEKLHATSLLLLSRIDKVRDATDRNRLVARIERETRGLFRGVFPVSLLRAVEAKGNHDAWAASGMAAVSKALDEVLAGAQPGGGAVDLAALRAARGEGAAPADDATDAPVLHRDAPPHSAEIVPGPRPDAPGSVVIPRRVTRGTVGRTARPRRVGGEGSLI